MSGWRLDQPVAGVPGRPIVILEKPFDLTARAVAIDAALTSGRPR